MKKIYAIYHQYEPTYKYEESIVSLWETKDLAEKELARIKEEDSHYDNLWISELNMNTPELY